MNIVLLSRDLMLLSRTQGAANKLAATLRNANSDDQATDWAIEPECRGVVIDLRAPGLNIHELVAALRESRGADFAIVACGPHVHEASLNAAREAGCNTVATRGQFERDAEAILASMLGQ
jgi:DNA-binding NarL/FixJ family response regulator